MSATPDRELIEAARAARRRAYAPYSGFRVGAAVRTADGRVFAGANVENASYGLTVCAERTALAAAVTAGARRIAALAVVGAGAPRPCGACRQVMAEFMAPEAPVWVAGPRGGAAARLTSGELLPGRFTLDPGAVRGARRVR